eukprot:1160552-Pelagomonas_calceolata.AAC.9
MGGDLNAFAHSCALKPDQSPLSWKQQLFSSVSNTGTACSCVSGHALALGHTCKRVLIVVRQALHVLTDEMQQKPQPAHLLESMCALWAPISNNTTA